MPFEYNPFTNKLDLVGSGGSATTDASLLTSGTLADARLSSNVSLDNINNNFSVGQSITAPANTSALTASYSVTGANTTPLLDLTGTWNTTGIANGIRLNITDTASNSTSRLIDLQTNGTTRFNVQRDGRVNLNTFSTGSAGLFSSAFFRTRSDGAYTFSASSNPEGTNDLLLQRDAAGTLALRNGGTAGTPVPQNFRVYNYTDAGLTNFERGFMRWNSNRLEVGTEFGGTGVARSLAIQLGASTTPLVFAASGVSGVDITAVRSMAFGSGITIGPSTAISNLSAINYTSGAADPTTTTLTSGNWQVYRNTTTGVVKLWANNAGTLVSVALA